MLFAYDTFTASASQTDFTLTFPYLAQGDVYVYVDGTLQTLGSANDYTFFASTVVRFNSAMAGGEIVVIRRKTRHSSRITDFTAGALTEGDLDNDSLQAFYMAQEALDDAANAFGLASGSLNTWDAESNRIINVGTPTASTDAATKAYADAIATAVAADAAAASASAAAALASENAAATSEANAAASALAAGLFYEFDTSTSMADPGTGELRFNNATPASVTAIAISDLVATSGNEDISAFLATWDDSTNTTSKGLLTIHNGTVEGEYNIFNVTAITNNSGWYQLTVTHLAGSELPASGEDLYLNFSRTGDKGADGAGSGDVVGPASATDNAIALFDTTTGKLLQDGPGPTTSGLPLLAAGAGNPPAFGQVDTAGIADDAVTLAKMAAGTDGQIITYDASGDPTVVGPGTSGQLLTSNGAGAAPSFEDAPAGSGGLIGVQVFTQAESGNTYTATGGTNSVVVEVWGAGGSGGAGEQVCCDDEQAGGGGGAGYTRERITSSFSGVTVTVGAGGAAPTTPGANGNAGGTSSFGTLCSATGGGGGDAGASGSSEGGAGGAGANGTINLTGQTGGSSRTGLRGIGGDAAGGGGLGGARSDQTDNTSATAGTIPGGGGGGGNGNANPEDNGGAGGDGLVIVWEYA